MASSPTGSHRYLPRRRAPDTGRPARTSEKSVGPARWRRTARGCSTETLSMVRPTTCRCRPWRTVSTSGSSGIPGLAAGVLVVGGGADRHPGRLGGLLLGGLLGPSLAGPEDLPAHLDLGAERLLVVRAALGDRVLGHPEQLGRGQLLEGGLPV